MAAESVIQFLEESVRATFPPTVDIDFNPGKFATRDSITSVRVVASVQADELTYDQPGLLKLVDGKIVETDGNRRHNIEGEREGVDWRTELVANP